MTKVLISLLFSLLVACDDNVDKVRYSLGDICFMYCDVGCERVDACFEFPDSEEIACKTACLNECCLNNSTCNTLLLVEEQLWVDCLQEKTEQDCASSALGALTESCVSVLSNAEIVQ